MLRSPKLEILPPDNFTSLDEALENLYGYDWLIFINIDSVSFFLTRLRHCGHETSELDSIKVCALGDASAAMLEESHVHVDLVCGELSAVTIVVSLANFLGGRDKLTGLNFMIPQAAVGRDYVKPAIEGAGARADVVAAYRTTAANDSSLLRLRTIVESGGVDCVAFTDSAEVHAFARLLDTNDLSRLLKNVAVAALDVQTAATVSTFALTTAIKPKSPVIQSLVDDISAHFSA